MTDGAAFDAWRAAADSRPLPRFAPGERIGDYVVEQFVAEGGFSDVYRVHRFDRPLQPLALKAQPLTLAGPAVGSAEIGGIPHLVNVYEVGTDLGRGMHFAAMDFVAGTSLAALLAWLVEQSRRPTPKERRLLVARVAEVAAALAELHRRGFVHRDVKPANVLITGAADSAPLEGPAVLVDLGLVRTAGNAGPASTIVATLPYAAPEQLLGLDVDARADVFALGVTLHDLVAGRPPEWRRRRPAAGLEPLRELVPDCDVGLAAIVAVATDPIREHRHRSAAELHRDLQAWLDGRPVALRTRLSARKWLRRAILEPRRTARQLSGVALGLVLLAAAGVAMLGWWRRLDLHERARDAWQRGDLCAAAELPAAADADGPCARDAEIAALLTALRAGDLPAGRRQALGLVARDGPEARPFLVDWISLQLAGGLSHDVDFLRAITRACYDLPAAPEGAAVRGLVGRLHDVIGNDTRDAALYAVTTLGCLGEAADVPKLMDAVERCGSRHAYPAEFLRLALETTSRILSRSSEPPAALAAIGEAALPRFLKRIPSLSQEADNERRLFSAAQGYFVTLRRLRDRARLPAPDWRAFPFPETPPLTIRALCMDAELRQHIRDDQLTTAERANPFTLGFVLAVTRTPPATVERLLRSTDPGTAARTENQVRAGQRHGEECLGPEDHRWDTTPGTRRVDELTPAEPPRALPSV